VHPGKEGKKFGGASPEMPGTDFYVTQPARNYGIQNFGRLFFSFAFFRDFSGHVCNGC
jgi:hypothetical protein